MGLFPVVWRLTGGVVVSCEGITVAVVAVVSKQGLVVVVLVPVERLDFKAAALGVSADDAGHSLVHLVWRACGIFS